jgi:hypothetical protein
LLAAQERSARFLVVAEALVNEPEVRPCPKMIRLGHHQVLEQRPRLFRLARLEVAKREVLGEGRVARKFAHELLVDLDRPRVEAEPKVHHGQEVLPLGIARLKLERLLELLLRLVHAVVLQQLAAAVEMEEKILGGVGGRHPMPVVRGSASIAALHSQRE